ncbi:Peroxidase 4 [Hibiscus syriacus]|uniref:peroxidase n=1 Tax=Hibiscus syriacus TaxID=106335 RepID=A0A6A3D981_HIBSY|nr:Peroxidase 4 [Hibiscus syriacus]
MVLFTEEKNANANCNSARGFDVVDNIKSAVENVCPGVVSCEDILAIAARDWSRTIGQARCTSFRSHTIGQARCTSFRPGIYNENNIDASFDQTRQRNCPTATGSGDHNFAPLDIQTPTSFDNDYFQNLVNNRGLLHSDQKLFNGGSMDSVVRGYANNPSPFQLGFRFGDDQDGRH